MPDNEVKPCVMGGCDLSRWAHRLEWKDGLGTWCYFRRPGLCQFEKIFCPLPRPPWWRDNAPAPQMRIGGPVRQTSLFAVGQIQKPTPPRFEREPGDDTGHE